MTILNHQCLECNFVQDKTITNGYMICTNCNTKNDVWNSKLSKPYFRHMFKYIKNYIKIHY